MTMTMAECVLEYIWRHARLRLMQDSWFGTIAITTTLTATPLTTMTTKRITGLL